MLCANVHNYLADAKQVKVRLEQTAAALELPADVEQTVEIPAGGEQRVDWRVKAAHEGEAGSACSALTDEESDAMEMSFPVYVHGMLKTDSYSGIAPARPTTAARSKSPSRTTAGPSKRGSKSATRRRSPGRWSTPCPTSSTIPTAAPSKRSTASCPR